MQSIKNTAVTIILLFLSYGVYQVITQPLPSESVTADLLEISDPSDIQLPEKPASFQNEFLTKLDRDTVNGSFQLNRSAKPESKVDSFMHSDPIPPKLLELDNDSSESFNAPATCEEARHGIEDRFNNSLKDQPFATNQGAPQLSAPQPPQFPVAQASSAPDARTNSESTQFVDFQQDASNSLSNIRQQFDSDTRIIPQTATESVVPRPNASDFAAEPADQGSGQRQVTLTESWPSIQRLVEETKFQTALSQLSQFYRTGNIQLHEREQLLDWLDALAAKVIYSSEHHLRAFPYIVQPGDTIGSLARKWQVPAQLIYNVNARQIPDPNQLSHGIEIKHIQGPFDAEIDSNQGIMTLYLDDLYAGRFEIKSGQTVPTGEFQIVDKAVRDEANRPFWMELNNGASIFASSQTPTDQSAIGMELEEAEEVFSILSASSKIRVMR